MTSLGRSVRKACLLVGMTRPDYDYRPVLADRDEKLRERMRDLAHHPARGIIESWRIDYNNGRPHSALAGLTPREYIENMGRTLTAVGR